jgi:recombination associated protein RdgC
MGLLKGSFTFARFHVDGQLPQAFLNFVNSRIRANSFRDVLKSTEEKRLGWVSLTDILDTDFKNADYALGDYLIFSLRIDRKLIPPKLMKIKLMEEERRFLAQSGGAPPAGAGGSFPKRDIPQLAESIQPPAEAGGFLQRGKNRINKQMASAMKDKVKLELLTKLDAIPSFYDVCWAVGKNTVYFSSLADKVADDFIDLFKKTFSLNIRRFLPQENNLITKESESTETVSLIGREFLTWLWFKSEERNGRIKTSDTEEVELHFLKRIALEAGEGEYSQGVVCHGIHAELKEGKEALRQGKKVKEAGIKLIHNQNEWEFTFKSDSFHFQSLKLPQTDWQETKEDPSGNLLERIYLIENAVKTIDSLYESFLQIRYSPQWEGKETKLLTKWLEHK